MRDGTKAEGFERRQGRKPAAARSEQSRVKRQVLGDRKGALQGVGVAYEMHLLGDAFIGRRRQREVALRERKQSGERAQQCRFAGAVAAGDDEALSGFNDEGESREDDAAAAFDREA